MQPLIDNARLFGQRPEESARIEGRPPQVLFLTCSDSRVAHALIMVARPAELFELRTVSNPLPSYASVVPTGRHCEVPRGNVREHRMEFGTFELV
ncbi:carbonic anhydrase [Streptomyces sp. AK010]|nr:carbonic anhydrase [Streptomyces sp. AK010]